MSLNGLNLSGLRLRCDCEMIWMRGYFSELSVHISSLSDLKCAMPSKYAGTPIILFNPPECKNFEKARFKKSRFYTYIVENIRAVNASLIFLLNFMIWTLERILTMKTPNLSVKHFAELGPATTGPNAFLKMENQNASVTQRGVEITAKNYFWILNW